MSDVTITERQLHWLDHIRVATAFDDALAEHARSAGFTPKELYYRKGILRGRGLLDQPAENPDVIEKVIAQLDQKTTESPRWPRPAARRRNAACSIHQDEPASTLQGCADDRTATMPAERGKQGNEPVAAPHAGAVPRLSGNQFAAANTAHRYRRR